MDHRYGVNRCPHCSGKTDEHKASDGLADYSSRDKPWDVHRAQAEDVQAIYATVEDFERYAQRIDQCSGVLRFGWHPDPDTGEVLLRLREAHFCRVRHCPVCQWRRSLMWQARFYQSLPAIQQAHPKARWLFLTLTVRNCPVGQLGETLTAMNAAWQRLIKRKEFRPVLGWVRTTEVTRGRDGSAHPHFHALLMVPPSMLSGKNYVKQARWVELWQEAMRLDYAPVVDADGQGQGTKRGGCRPGGRPAEGGGRDPEIFRQAVRHGGRSRLVLEMTKQVHKRRFVATGGALKDVLRVEEETDEDLTLADGPAPIEDDGSRLAFNWRSDERRYRRFPKADKPADAGE